MDKTKFKEIVGRLKEADKIIKSLDPAIRDESFKLLEPYLTSAQPTTTGMPKGRGGRVTGDPSSMATFIAKFNHDKPSDNVLLLTAYHFSQNGSEAFSVDEVKTMATDAGLIIPDRLEMTLRTASRKSKKLFATAGRSKFKPTVHGEKYFVGTYDASKGTKKKPSEPDK